jgi:homoserine kinase
MTAAMLYLNKVAPTLASAAICCGSNVRYVRAAVILQQSENTALARDVLAGHVSLQTAAAQVQRVSDLVSAYRHATEPDRVAFARACNAEQIFDVLVKAS